MIRNSQLTIRPAKNLDYNRLGNLIHFETHVHRHLDWLAPLDWIEHSPFIVAEQNGHMEGVLACPQEPPGVAWVRVFGVVSERDPLSIWRKLWPEALAILRQSGTPTIAALPLQEWFGDLLLEEGFLQTTRVVFLMWADGHKLPEMDDLPVTIRPMLLEDIPAVTEVDNQAFSLLWRNSDIALGAAFNQSAISTVVEDSHGIVGYQISTASPLGGHLARLAVLPRAQGKQIGSALLLDLLHKFKSRGIIRVSVNTQENNLTSLRLYQRFGFQRTEEAYPVLVYPD